MQRAPRAVLAAPCCDLNAEGVCAMMLICKHEGTTEC